MAAKLLSSRHTPGAGIPAHGVCRLHSQRRGLTLLELILALGLSAMLLFAVAMALRLYWRSFDTKRTNVEQAHLARAVLQRIAGDIHSAVQHTPVDLSGLESMTASYGNVSSALSSMTGGGASGAAAGGSNNGGAGATGGATGSNAGGSPTGGAGGGASSSATQAPAGQSGQGGGGSTSASPAANSGATSTGGASSTQSGGSTPSSGNSTSGGSSGGGASATGQAATDATAADTTEKAPPIVAGLYGSANQLQFDVSRLPRVDEYAGGSTTSMVQIPSDLKTVSYYVRNETTAGSSTSTTGTPAPGSSEPSTTGQGRGLMRMEIDRAVSAYIQSNGASSVGYDSAKLLADEVTSITFRYWNGTEWATEWNSDDMGGLPLAIEVVLTMADPNAVPANASTAQSFGASAATTSTEPSYRIVVNLPTASLPPPAEETTTTGDTTASGTGATGTTGGSTGGTNSGSSGATSGASGGSSPGGSTKTGATK